MSPAIDLLRQAQGLVFENPDGIQSSFKLLPPLSSDELVSLESRIPCPIPEEMKELFYFARGFEGGWLQTVDFSGFAFSDGMGFGMESLFPRCINIAHDGLGNYWVVDLTSDSKTWGPIFYACHDGPVIVFQSESISHFISECLKGFNTPWQSDIDDVLERFADKIWRENPGVMKYESCIASEDVKLRAFAQTLDASWEFIDLRSSRVGDGFSWGRYGPRTVNKRFDELRIFAYQRKGLGQRIRDAFR